MSIADVDENLTDQNGDLSSADVNGQIPRDPREYAVVHRDLDACKALNRIKVQVSGKTHRKIRVEAARHGMSISQFSAWRLEVDAESFLD